MGGSSKSKSTTAPTEHWLPGQQAYLPEFLQPLKNIYKGEWTDPYMLGLQRQKTEQAQKEARLARGRVSSSGLPTPAKAKSLQEIEGSLIGAVAGVPGEIWQTVSQVLAQYALTPPQIGQAGRSTSKGWSFLA